MVYYFQCSTGHVIYMGKDKFENENLLKFAWPEDIWFHVDDYSSAHVYFRLKRGEELSQLPKQALDECCQLVKENSIEGSKQKSLKIVYTMASNVIKGSHMLTGTVGFANEKALHYVRNVEKDKIILKQIEKTRKEQFPDLEKMLIDRNQLEKNEKKKIYQELQLQNKEEEAKRQEVLNEQIKFDLMLSNAVTTNNADNCEAEEDFM